MVKAYLKYERLLEFGVVCGSGAVFGVVPGMEKVVGGRGVVVAAPAAGAVILWNVRQGAVVARLMGDAAARAGRVTALAVAPDGQHVAVGYADGSVRVWAISAAVAAPATTTHTPVCTFTGHKSPVSSLAWNTNKTRLVSGSSDGDLVLWDFVSERGLFRVHSAHSNQISSVLFLDSGGLDHIVSASKDGVLKVYDVSTQHCAQVVVGHRGEIWCAAISNNGSLLATGSADSLVRVWTVGTIEGDRTEILCPIGHISRRSSGRTVHLSFGTAGQDDVFAVHGSDKSVEVYRIRTPEEAEKHRKRRKSRLAEKRKRKAPNENVFDEENQDADLELEIVTARDFFLFCQTFTPGFKCRAAVFMNSSKKSAEGNATVLVQLHNNSVELYKVPLKKASDDVHASKKNALVVEGHRGDVRGLAISSNDDSRVVSVSSSKTVKLWNGADGKCIRTSPLSGYGLCCALFPTRGPSAGKYVIVGTKTGAVEAVDLQAATEVFSFPAAHGGPVWTTCVLANNKEFATGGADKKVNIWEFENPQEAEGPSLQRTLELTDDVLCMRATTNGKLLVVSLLDATVRAFHMDSLKQFLSFYGHKLPVLSLDVSTDGSLLVTGSADKTIKIWGLDFGDCRRSIRAHEDSVMSVVFQPFTHYFFSGSRDGTIKYWDGDRQELITHLDGTSDEVWSLCISDDGEVLCSASHDRSIRIWRRTDEQIFLEEEREKRMDEMFEKTAIEEVEGGVTPSKFALGPGRMETETEMAGKRSLETVKAGERLMEAITLGEGERSRDEGDDPSPLVLGLTADKFVLRTLKSIRSADLDQALLLLPLKEAMILLGYAERWLGNASLSAVGAELFSRVAMFLLKLHLGQIVANGDRGQISHLGKLLQNRLMSNRAVLGFNLAGLRYWANELQQRDMTPFQKALGESRKKAKKSRAQIPH